MIFRIVEIISCFIEIYIMYSIIRLLKEEKEPLLQEIIFCGIWTVVILFINSKNFFSFLPLIIFPLYVGITSFRLYRYRVRDGMFLALFYVFVIYVLDFLTASAISLLIKNNQYVLVAFSETGIERLFFILIAKVEMITLYLVFRKLIAKQNRFNKYNVLFYIAFIGFICIFSLIEETFMMFNQRIALIWLFLAIIISLVMGILIIYLKDYNNKTRIEFLRMRNELVEKNYSELKTVYETNSKLFHDFKNHTTVMNKLLVDGSYQALADYIGDLDIMKREAVKNIWTGDSVVDFILNSKLEEAKKAGIAVTVNAEFPRNTNIKPSDITTVLTNILDNAIESCKRIEDGRSEKYIIITIRRIHHMLIIKVNNSCDKVHSRQNKFHTLKKNKQLHGWGLLSVDNVAERYGGCLETVFHDSSFTTVVTLSFTVIEAGMAAGNE